ncbi:YhcN/YlaJ family sporulation lipoprotein [Niallia sp. XMNu-256]|uniref:YhcN/YlaJ family sporulation lipoprotein n=1 Tax=Niallia sp. XMNu-256 TaxID=3082444 RepID=UPI0030CAA4F7
MKWKPFLSTLSLSALLLAACGINNNAMDDTNNINQPTRDVAFHTPQTTNEQQNKNDFVGDHRYQEQINVDDQNFRRNYAMSRLNTTQTTNNGNQNQSRFKVADHAARKIADLKEVDSANVIITDHNAYVAVNLENPTSNKVARNMEEKISRIVNSTVQNIENVYVSQDPNFVNRMTTYSNDIRNGRPVEGFMDEFGETVRRVFPNQR